MKTISNALDISYTKSILMIHPDDTLRKRLIATTLKIPIHYFTHCRFGFNSLAIYYRKAFLNDKISDLLRDLSNSIDRNKTEIPKIVRQIISTLYKSDLKNDRKINW